MRGLGYEPAKLLPAKATAATPGFARGSGDTLPKYCRECEVRFACNGECPRHRFEKTPDGEEGLNYLCAGYKKFFKHIDPTMRKMADLMHARMAPASIMGMLPLGAKK